MSKGGGHVPLVKFWRRNKSILYGRKTMSLVSTVGLKRWSV